MTKTFKTPNGYLKRISCWTNDEIKMNYTNLLNELNQASSFDLFRLRSIINTQLDDPARIFNIKKKLFIGQEISYFEEDENRLINATILEFKRTRVVVRNTDDNHVWQIFYYHINVDNVETSINSSKQQKLDRTNLKVGDNVSFYNKNGTEIFGVVDKLNPKTAGITTKDGKWRVSYVSLSLVIEGEISRNIIEHDN